MVWAARPMATPAMRLAAGPGVFPVGENGDAARAEGDDPGEDDGDHDQHDEMRQFGVDEFLGVADPFVEDFAEKAAFGKDAGADKKSQKNHVHSSILLLLQMHKKRIPWLGCTVESQVWTGMAIGGRENPCTGVAGKPNAIASNRVEIAKRYIFSLTFSLYTCGHEKLDP